jgi:membrane protein
MSSLSSIRDSLRRWLSRPGDELSRWQRAARWSLDLGWHCARELKHDRASEMAAALTYRTIFSLIPVLVLGLVVFNAFDGFQELRGKAQDTALEYLGLTTITYPSEPLAEPDVRGKPGAAAEKAIEQGDTPAERQAVERGSRALVVETIDGLVENIERLNFASIGAVGFLVLVWAALALVISLEQSLNRVFGAVQGRSYATRIAMYWSVLTLGPALALLSAYTATRLGQQLTEQVVAFEQQQEWTFLSASLKFLGRFVALGASWLLLMFLYVLMPNTQVRLRAAAIGAFVAAALWEVAKWAFGLYVQHVVPYSMFYGTLGLIPLFLFWVYVTWLIVLFGAELTHTLQAMRGRQFKHGMAKQPEDQVIDVSWFVPLATRIAESFAQGRPCPTEKLSRSMNLSPRTVQRMLVALDRAGVIHHLADKDGGGGVTLARPPDRIAIGEVLDAGRSLQPKVADGRDGDPAWRLARELSDQPKLHQQTLADLCQPKRASA